MAKKGGAFVAEPRAGMTTTLGSFTKGPRGRAAYGAAKAANTKAGMKAHGVGPGKASRRKAGAGGGGGGG
jgi:hypothetical protein